MTSTFEFTAKAGEIRIEATYEEVLAPNIVDADGHSINLGDEPTTAGRCNMELYLNGKKIDDCWNPAFWKLIDIKEQPGIKKIWGLKIGMTKENAEKYEQFLAGLIDGGTSDEVKAYRQAKADKNHARKIESAKKTVARAEAQEEILTEKETIKKQKRYNDVHNEGGDGYVPDWVTLEEYEAAKKSIAEAVQK